jgi:hypothetical protein
MSTSRRLADAAFSDIERLWDCNNRAAEAILRLLDVFNREGMPSDAGERLEAYVVLGSLRAVVARLENIETFVGDMLRS